MSDEPATGPSTPPSEPTGQRPSGNGPESPPPLDHPADGVADDGIALPPLEAIGDDAELAARIWMVAGWMAARGCYVVYSDHLTDRELYVKLREEIVPDELAEGPTLPPESSWVDLAVLAAGEDEATWVRYYRSEEERIAFFDGDPPSSEKPADRDRLWPRPWCPDPGAPRPWHPGRDGW